MQRIKNFLDNKNAKIAIWGFGKTGKSYLDFCYKNNFFNITIIDKKEINSNYNEFKDNKNIKFINQLDLNNQMLNDFDYIMLSPGINIRNEEKKIGFLLKELKKKFIVELDLFHYFMKNKTVIGITGSFGKTSITTLLSQILSIKYNVLTGGNIGYPLLNLIDKETDFYILEISSAQLEFTKYFSPTYPVITNIVDNHIDYHLTFENYLKAKSKILTNHKSNIEGLFISYNTYNLLNINNKLGILKKYFFYDDLNNEKDILIYITEKHKAITYIKNWIFIYKFLNTLNINFSIVNECIKNLKVPEHRLELCKESNSNLKIYNDSKSTIMHSTFFAAEKLKNEHKDKDLIIIIGGLSKGANRKNYIYEILKFVKNIIFFGSEIDLFKIICRELEISNVFFETSLENAVDKSIELSNNNAVILFSPGGSSFDLFESYEHRGNCFKKLISEKLL